MHAQPSGRRRPDDSVPILDLDTIAVGHHGFLTAGETASEQFHFRRPHGFVDVCDQSTDDHGRRRR